MGPQSPLYQGITVIELTLVVKITAKQLSKLAKFLILLLFAV